MERIISDNDPYGEEIWNDMSKVYDPDKWLGNCECGEYNDAILNVGKSHWGYCPKCMTRWYIGGNLFSSWKHEDQRDWDQNREYLLNFREINSE